MPEPSKKLQDELKELTGMEFLPAESREALSDEIVAQAAAERKRQNNARELAKIRAEEASRKKRAAQVARDQASIAAQEALADNRDTAAAQAALAETSFTNPRDLAPTNRADLADPSVRADLRVQMTTTTKQDVVKLLQSLNINTNLQLTKNDTANLLATLLTANETQLKVLMNNRKVPIAIKTVIKALLTAANVGDMTTVERLWDRVFGKTAMTDSLSSVPGSYSMAPVAPGLIPNAPISREALILIRETMARDAGISRAPSSQVEILQAINK